MGNILICWEREVTEWQHWGLTFVFFQLSLDKSSMYSQNSPLLFQVLSETVYMTVSDTDSKTDLQMGTVVCPSDEKDIRRKAPRR